MQKNDSEKELLKLQRIHTQQQEDHQGHTAKMGTLEATVKQQEKVRSNVCSADASVWFYLTLEIDVFKIQVIEKMEKALDSRLKEKAKQSDDKRVMIKKQKGRRTLE